MWVLLIQDGLISWHGLDNSSSQHFNALIYDILWTVTVIAKLPLVHIWYWMMTRFSSSVFHTITKNWKCWCYKFEKRCFFVCFKYFLHYILHTYMYIYLLFSIYLILISCIYLIMLKEHFLCFAFLTKLLVATYYYLICISYTLPIHQCHIIDVARGICNFHINKEIYRYSYARNIKLITYLRYPFLRFDDKNTRKFHWRFIDSFCLKLYLTIFNVDNYIFSMV